MQHAGTPATSGSSPISSPTSNPLTRRSAMLPDLPPEILIEVFKATDSFTTALALSKTCRHIHSVWKVNADTILPFIIECFPQAQDLANAQEKNHTHLQNSPSPQTHITTSSRILMNTNFALRLLQHFEKSVISASEGREQLRGGLSPKEQADFLRGSYRAMTIAASGRHGRLSFHFLEPLDMLEYMQMREAMDILNLRFCNSPLPGNLRARDSPIGTDYPITAISRASCDLMLFHYDLMQLRYDFGDFKNWHRVAFDYYTVVEGYQAKVGSGRGPRLADLIQMIREGKIRSQWGLLRI